MECETFREVKQLAGDRAEWLRQTSLRTVYSMMMMMMMYQTQPEVYGKVKWMAISERANLVFQDSKTLKFAKKLSKNSEISKDLLFRMLSICL